ncbi:MAG: outer membrane beta-barrel protein [Bacteroidota bacterium]
MSDKIDFKAFNEDGMDEFLRKTVEGHSVEPKPGLWKDISRRLLWRELAHFNFTNLSVKSRIAGSVGVLILAAAFYFLWPGSNPVTPSAESAAVSARADISQIAEASPAPSTAPREVKQPAAGEVKIYNTNNLTAASGKPKEPSSSVKPAVPSLSTSHNTSAYANNIPIRSAKPVAREREITPDYTRAGIAGNGTAPALSMESGISQLIPFEASLLEISPGRDTIITIHNSYGTASFLKTQKNPASFFSASIGVMPELSFYSAPESYSKLNCWADAGVTYHFSRFSLSTSIGLGYVFDRAKYRAEYKSNDSVGYFTNVVSFTVGSNNEIIYKTVNKSIYDSLLHQDDYRTLNRYTYMQVPLLLGYRLVESGNFSLAFRAGPAISFLLATRKSSSSIEYANARVIRVDDNTPARAHTNWQLWGDLFLEFRINKKFSIYVEPSCKYFLTPMIEQENIRYKAPWSVGLGVGLQLNFAPNKKNQ